MHELSRRDLIALTGFGLLAAGCGSSGDDTRRTSSNVPGAAPKAHAAAPKIEDVAVDAPEDLTQPLLSSDVLVYSKDTLPKSTIDKIRAIKGKDGKQAIMAVEPMAMGQFYVDEQPVTYAAVDPKTFWRYTVPGTAHTADVWKRVAGGEIAVGPQIGRELQTKDGYLKLGNGTDAPSAHVGAYAQLLDPAYARQIDAVVNYKWTKPLGMTSGNAALISMGATSPQSIMKKLQAAAGSGASIQILGTNVDLSVAQTAVLTGGAVANKIGTFNYTANGNGTVNPDPAWVANYIRTEQMPIIGPVRGNRIMLPQLRRGPERGRGRGAVEGDLPVRRLLRAALHRRHQHALVPQLRHRDRPQRAGQPARHRRQDGPPRGHDLQAVGLRLGRRLALHRPDALRARHTGQEDLIRRR